ncbi:phosphopantothenoylcysteine decarboxylase [Pararge aegeria]|uniref:Phosphopantothenoylcysteine decarboxylase n=1 Tax=Pararge aegeria aegeria TaxID=348720 RepID=A0A8S4R6I3_9NEOP|nr:phosphopantothenoylcysteine decarboxylase [Pararge aegeria]CAH2229885.1 jg8261 [Pararge aegeria aegeria]
MSGYTINILIGVTGSVASIKLPLLVQSLIEINQNEPEYYFEVKVVCTEHAKHFFKTPDLPPTIPVIDDATEWEKWKGRGDEVVHIELGKWADMMVIAPLDANTLAKISQGICDNVLTSTVRAWDLSKPLLFCPAMNTRMWEHPITSVQLTTLKLWGYTEIPPISKTLMCGDSGMGAMAEVDDIVTKIKSTAHSLKLKKLCK